MEGAILTTGAVIAATALFGLTMVMLDFQATAATQIANGAAVHQVLMADAQNLNTVEAFNQLQEDTFTGAIPIVTTITAVPVASAPAVVFNPALNVPPATAPVP